MSIDVICLYPVFVSELDVLNFTVDREAMCAYEGSLCLILWGFWGEDRQDKHISQTISGSFNHARTMSQICAYLV